MDRRARGELPPLRRFILAGGNEAGAGLHFARAVCRRAERRMVGARAATPSRPIALMYINRLSDLLFTMARAANARAGRRRDRVVADAAYAACLRLARQHYENFPVASRLLPPASRPHIAAIYAFARMADDFADEGDLPPRSRLALLDDWRDAAARRSGRTPGPGRG